MQRSIRIYALAECAAILVSGCATQQNAAPEFRLSSSAPAAAVPGASMLQRGRAQLDAGLNALAIEAFRAEIRTNPDAADAYNGLAVAYGRIGRDDLAQRYFETALAKDPGNGKAQANLARLTDDTAPITQMAQADIPVFAIEPVAIATMTPDDPIGQLITSIEVPALASSVAASQRSEQSAPPANVLARRGVLSTRFAVAPARFVTVATSVSRVRYSAPRKPDELPQLPELALPSGYLAPDHRGAGTRLVRVSLGEVQLITRPQTLVKTAIAKSDFTSFGDRLAIWLPQTIAIEQTRPGNIAKAGAVLLAAIERAEQAKKFVSGSVIDVPELSEFAYLSFDAAEVVADV